MPKSVFKLVSRLIDLHSQPLLVCACVCSVGQTALSSFLLSPGSMFLDSVVSNYISPFFVCQNLVGDAGVSVIRSILISTDFMKLIAKHELKLLLLFDTGSLANAQFEFFLVNFLIAFDIKKY